MLAVGRALMSAPKLLMLDEPSLGLAPLIVREIFRIIVQLREQGTSILLIEQNARAALEVADHGYVLETGAIALEGPAAAAGRRPAGDRDLPGRCAQGQLMAAVGETKPGTELLDTGSVHHLMGYLVAMAAVQTRRAFQETPGHALRPAHGGVHAADAAAGQRQRQSRSSWRARWTCRRRTSRCWWTSWPRAAWWNAAAAAPTAARCRCC